ncbi:hypothetical protein [Streptomyces tibetensis]|uniref:hypothetical protein n=1 Tax=Streptomyces tibetensis TaxID=2382123 RepID=UPI0034082478
MVREVDEAALVPDPQRTIAEGAVAPWSMFGLTVMPQVVAEFGVRTDVPYTALTAHERDIVMHGPAEQRHISVRSKNGKFSELDFTYRNARRAVEEALNKATTERGLNRVNRFISAQVCPACHGTRLSEQARATLVDGINLAQATAKTLDELIAWAPTLADALPSEMHPMARNIVAALLETARRLVELGLGACAKPTGSSRSAPAQAPRAGPSWPPATSPLLARTPTP